MCTIHGIALSLIVSFVLGDEELEVQVGILDIANLVILVHEVS